MDKKKRLITMVVTLLVLTIGVTFAYFMARTGEGKQAGTTITTGTVDDLKFNVSKENLSLNINQFNFASGSGNLSDNVTATASLKANSTKNTATYNYYVYFQIESNDYVYTTTDKKPEIVLSITGPNGEITSVDGLTYVSATNADGIVVKGFDITTLGKSITKIADSYEISSSSSTNYTNQEWNLKVTFINLDTNQSGNQNKNLTGKVLIQQEEIKTTLAEYIISQYTGTQGENGIYYHDANLTNGTNDNSYRYAGASEAVNNYVCFGSNVTPCPADNLYRIIGVFGDRVKLIKSDYATTALLGTDGDYSKMYTATGYISSNYKGNNLANKAGYTWNYKNNTTINSGNGSNTWSTSLLNKTNLNKNFITNIGADWAAKIAETTWKVGGNTWANIGTQPAKTAYQNEIVSPVTTNSTDNATEYSAKIGLMYASDYMYAAPQDKWTLVGYNDSDDDASKDYRAATSVNWMYMGLCEWTISRRADLAFYVFFVSGTGEVSSSYTSNTYGVRPVFYLSSSVNYASGSGTAADPILVT